MKSVKHEKRLTFLVFKDYFLRKKKKKTKIQEKNGEVMCRQKFTEKQIQKTSRNSLQ